MTFSSQDIDQVCVFSTGKFIIYSAFARFFIPWLGRQIDSSEAIAIGLLRTVLGLISFPMIFGIMSFINGPSGPNGPYGSKGSIFFVPFISIPFKWIGWAMIEPIAMQQGVRTWFTRDFWKSILKPGNNFKFRVAGVACSLLADIVVFVIMGGLLALC